MLTEEQKKLGQNQAFACMYGTSENGYLQEGMSKRFYAANNSIAVADNTLKEFSIKSIAEYIGIEPSEYKHYLHYPVALSKMSYVIANELLKHENIELL